MKKLTFIFSLLLANSSLFADSTTAVVTFSILPVTTISISGNPGNLSIAPNSTQSDTSTTWSVTCNCPNKQIYGSIDSELPPGVVLAVDLEAPNCGTSMGSVALSTTPQLLISEIASCSSDNLQVKYTIAADSSASPVTAASRIVTYTVGP